MCLTNGSAPPNDVLGAGMDNASGRGMSSEAYHEADKLLSEETKDMHRAITSLREELDAVDWYRQRSEACTDDELRAVLVHNKNEEVEHAMMVLEWIRRHSDVFDANVTAYLGSTGPITEVEKQKTAAPEPPSASLGIGSLRNGS